MLIPLLILFFILVAGFGIENTFKILPPLIILGLLIYFLGWIAVKYFWIILPIWFISKLLSNKNKGSSSTYSRTYRRTNDDFFNSGSTNRTTYGGTFNSREEAEEFLELSLAEVLDKAQQILVVILTVDIVVRMVVVAIKELLIHTQQIKVNTTLF